jgi:hypothetical protein
MLSFAYEYCTYIWFNLMLGISWWCLFYKQVKSSSSTTQFRIWQSQTTTQTQYLQMHLLVWWFLFQGGGYQGTLERWNWDLWNGINVPSILTNFFFCLQICSLYMFKWNCNHWTMDMKKEKVFATQRDHLMSVYRSQIILQTHRINALNKSTIKAAEYHRIHTTYHRIHTTHTT